jgi:hypothetical protein
MKIALIFYLLVLFPPEQKHSSVGLFRNPMNCERTKLEYQRNGYLADCFVVKLTDSDVKDFSPENQ